MFTISVPGHVISLHRSSLAVCGHRQNASFLNPFTSTVPTTTINSNFLKSTTLLRSIATILTASLYLEDGSGWISGGSYGGGGGRSDGGRHGSDGGNFCSWLLCPVAIADENQLEEWDSHGLPANIVVQLNELRGSKRYKVSDIVFLDSFGTDDLVFKMVSLHPGGVYTKSQLEKELQTLNTSGMFGKVDFQGKTNPDGTIAVTILFLGITYNTVDRCLKPPWKPIEMGPNMKENEKISNRRSKDKDYRRRIEREILQMQMLKDKGKCSVRLLQKITDKFQEWCHDYAQELREEEFSVIWVELQKRFHQGRVFISEAGKEAWRNMSWLAPDEKHEEEITVKTDVKKVEKESGPDLSTISDLDNDSPTISCRISNFCDFISSFIGCVSIGNFLKRVEYVCVKDVTVSPYDKKFFRHVNYCSQRRGVEQDSFIIRSGCKFDSTENITVDCKGRCGFILERIKPRQISPNTQILIGNDTHYMGVLQGDITTDNTKLVNGAIVGQRHVIQVEKGVIMGSMFGLFGRYSCSVTQFIQLKEVEEGPPPVLMVHGKYGSCIGNIPAYEAFTLGRSCSITGYRLGGLCAARKILKLGAELRIPVKKNLLVYAFAEHENDLWSAYRLHHGSFYGFGIKWWLVGAEYIVDHNLRVGQYRLRLRIV